MVMLMVKLMAKEELTSEREAEADATAEKKLREEEQAPHSKVEGDGYGGVG